MWTLPRLVGPLFRFMGQDVVRSRRLFVGAVLAFVATVAFMSAVRGVDSESEGFGLVLLLGLLVIASPLCRPWVDQDVRLGYAAWWLQKPVAPVRFYLAHLMALVGWSLVAALGVGLAAVPAALVGGVRPAGWAELLVSLGWIPTVLAVLSFIGSAAGARNGGLFAYAMLFGGFALPQLSDAARLGAIYDAAKLVFPPAEAALATAAAVRESGLAAAPSTLWPLVAYTLAGAALALLLALQVERRLAGQASD